MNKEKYQKIKNNISLKNYNTMKIDCVADYFLEAKSEDDILCGLEYAEDNNIPFLILGGGSNVILPEKFKGIVIIIKITFFNLREENDKIVVRVSSGYFLPDIAKKVSLAGGHGIEWAGGVPGTVGGAVRGNAGAFSNFMADYTKEVLAINVKNRKKEIFTKEECMFDYRESVFKKNKEYILLEVKMNFPKKIKNDNKYEEYLDYRKKNHPEEPSAGSIFKNPEIGEDFYEKYPETKKFKELGFVPVSFLIESCNLKGKRIGGCFVSEKHANFIVNKDGTGKDVIKLIEVIKKEVKRKYSIEIEEEVEIIE